MKKQIFKKIQIVMFAILISPQLFAHALWVETKASGNKGKPQEINVYFGEFSDKDITPTAKWFSDLKDFTLILISPSKKESKLTSVALENSYQAFFTPTENGVYTIVMRHTPKDIYGTMRLDYHSSATVSVGEKISVKIGELNSNEISLISENIKTAKKNKSIKIIAYTNSTIAANKEIKVIAPNGWTKELYTDKNGEVEFTPLWPGNYVAEFAYTVKTEGELNGKKFNEVWKMATYFFIVK